MDVYVLLRFAKLSTSLSQSDQSHNNILKLFTNAHKTFSGLIVYGLVSSLSWYNIKIKLKWVIGLLDSELEKLSFNKVVWKYKIDISPNLDLYKYFL